MSGSRKPQLNHTVLIAIVALLAWVFFIIPHYKKQKETEHQTAEQAEQAEQAGEAGEPGRKGELSGPEGDSPPDSGSPGETPDQKAPPEQETPVPGEPAAPAAPDVTAAPDVPGEPGGPAEPGEPGGPEEPAIEEISDLTVETGRFIATIACRGAALRRLRFQPEPGGFGFEAHAKEGLLLLDELEADKLSLAVGGLTKDDHFGRCVYKLVSADKNFTEGVKRVVWRARASGLEVTKTFIFPADSFAIGLEVNVRSLAKEARDLRYRLRSAAGIVADDVANRYLQLTAVLAARPAREKELDLKWIYARKAAGVRQKSDTALGRATPEGEVDGLRLSSAGVEWAAVKNRYFTVILQPDEEGIVETAYAHPVKLAEKLADDALLGQPNVMVGLKTPEFALKPKGEVTHHYRLYAGPLSEEELGIYGAESDFSGLISYGWSWFNWLSRLLRRLLLVLRFITPGYGWAIILLTIVVKSLLHPLTKKSMISMQKMQKIQPQIAALKKKYESDKSPEAKRKMMREQQDLFAQHGVSPLGGCLPMLVQIPMLFALFGCFRGSFELRQAGFLWISDLSRPDGLSALPFTMPIVQWTQFNLLPVMYLAMMIVQHKLSPKPADPQAQQQQQMMMTIMPIMFFFIFYNMPSGLVLYFVASMVFTIVEQWHIRKTLAAEEEAGASAAVAAAASGTPRDPVPGGAKLPDGQKYSKRKKKGRRK